MPMKSGRSKTIISSNVRMMMHEGRPQKQAVAMAMDKAGMKRKMKKKKKHKMIVGGM